MHTNVAKIGVIASLHNTLGMSQLSQKGLLRFSSSLRVADPTANADLVVIMMQEGLAHVCSIGGR